MNRNRPTPIVHTERLLALVPYISTHQGVSTSELAAMFNVSVAQINNDLMTLWMCGLPGYTPLELMDLSFESGFVTIHNAPTLQSPRSLNSDEIVALLFGLDLILDSISKDSSLIVNVKELIERLSNKSPIHSRLRATNPVAGSLRAIIENSLNEKGALKINYHSLYSDSYSDRIISPLEMYSESGVEYLLSYCSTAKAFRTFRLDRIESAQSATLDLSSHLNQQTNSNPDVAYSIKVIERSRLMKERFSIPEVEDDEEIQLHSFSEQWIRRSICASSGSAQLIHPIEIRLEIAEKAQQLLERYRQAKSA